MMGKLSLSEPGILILQLISSRMLLQCTIGSARAMACGKPKEACGRMPRTSDVPLMMSYLGYYSMHFAILSETINLKAC